MASHAKYHALIEKGLLDTGCALCERESIKEFKFWRVIENQFPYDRIAEIHHMIIPKRHASDPDLSKEEKDEFEDIKKGYIDDTYEYLIESCHKNKTIPGHAHIHLITVKDE